MTGLHELKHKIRSAGLIHMWISPRTPLVTTTVNNCVDKFQDGTRKKGAVPRHRPGIRQRHKPEAEDQKQSGAPSSINNLCGARRLLKFVAQRAYALRFYAFFFILGQEVALTISSQRHCPRGDIAQGAKDISFSPTSASYLRFKSLDDNTQHPAAAAEIILLGGADNTNTPRAPSGLSIR